MKKYIGLFLILILLITLLLTSCTNKQAEVRVHFISVNFNYNPGTTLLETTCTRYETEVNTWLKSQPEGTEIIDIKLYDSKVIMIIYTVED
jgi:hypothetical protein